MNNLGDQHIHYNNKKWKKWPIWHYSWHKWKVYLGTVNGRFCQCQSCSGYIWLLDILIQLQKGASVDNISIEYHMLPFGRISKVFHVWNSVSHIKINQQHRETKYLWLVNTRFIRRNKCWKLMTLLDNNWCHMHIHINEKSYIKNLRMK